MKIIWLGHSSFRIEIGNQVLLVDPWLTGNPMLPEFHREKAIVGATHILVSHGHGDHAGDAVALSRQLSIPVVGIYDLMSWWEGQHEISVVGFNKGGTVQLGDVAVTMVNAVHSSSIATDNGPAYAGHEAGFMISGEGKTIYFSGDTDICMDMQLMQELHAPEIGILCAGGHFTMDMKRASYAARKFFAFDTLIPCHYRTFPLLEQSADLMKAELTDVNVVEPEVMVEITL